MPLSWCEEEDPSGEGIPKLDAAAKASPHPGGGLRSELPGLSARRLEVGSCSEPGVKAGGCVEAREELRPPRRRVSRPLMLLSS